MNVLWPLLIFLAYLALNLGALWPLAVWAQHKRHPAFLAIAGAVTVVAVALVIYAFKGTVPFPQRQPWEAHLAHALEPLLWLLLILPIAFCVAAAQTCVRAMGSPGVARGVSVACGALMTALAPLAFIGSAQGLAGVSL